MKKKEVKIEEIKEAANGIKRRKVGIISNRNCIWDRR